VIGTTGILRSIKKSAPSVKRVVITSSFAAIVMPSKGDWPGKVYSEEDWYVLEGRITAYTIKVANCVL
jgi:hypothetical protein